MPNWKKLIVSGSDASLNSLNVTTFISASSFTGSFTGSLFGTSSYATQALTSSYVLNAVSASFASTASSVNRLNQAVVISGSLTVSGSTNIIGDSGATLFSSNADTLILTGSLLTSGSIILTGSLSMLGSATGSLLGTASYATQALTASNANTASFVQTAQTASYVLNAISASFATSALTASNANTASYILNAVSSSFAATASSADNFTVRGTLTAQTIVAQTITSSTEFITGSTKFGSLLSNTHQFTGSIFATGSFTVGGTLIATTLSGSGAGLTDVGVVEKVFYVAEDGSDTNDGKTLSSPFRTIKAATIAASASRAANPGLPVYRQSIQVKSGYYTETAPITVPSNVSILGDDLRSVVVSPTSATSGSNLFLMNNGTYCYGLRLEGCRIDDLEDPRNGFFFAFAPSASIVTSPYVQNCSAISTPADKFYTPLNSGSANPLVGNGPGGMIVDDSVLDGYSPLKSMIVDAYTQVAFNGIGICVRGRGYAQLVSFFTNFSRVGVYCIEGGHASLLNSNTTFGDFGLRAKGKRMLVKPDISAVSASIDVSGSLLISANKANIQEYMTQQLLISGSYKENYYSGSTYCYKDSGLLIDAIADDLLVPGAARTSQFISGLFKGQDTSSGSVFTLPIASGSSFTEGAISIIPQNVSNASGSLTGDFILAWQYMKKYIVTDPSGNFSTMTTPAKNKVGQLFDVLISTITQVVVNGAGAQYLQEFGSLITSTSHDFSYAGAGVNFLALPLNQGGVGETNVALRIFEETGGRVFHTSGDETGDFYAGNDFIIRQATGTIEGRTFTKALSAQFTPLNLALETYS
jgi:hypothetical protein